MSSGNPTVQKLAVINVHIQLPTRVGDENPRRELDRTLKVTGSEEDVFAVTALLLEAQAEEGLDSAESIERADKLRGLRVQLQIGIKHGYCFELVGDDDCRLVAPDHTPFPLGFVKELELRPTEVQAMFEELSRAT